MSAFDIISARFTRINLQTFGAELELDLKIDEGNKRVTAVIWHFPNFLWKIGAVQMCGKTNADRELLNRVLDVVPIQLREGYPPKIARNVTKDTRVVKMAQYLVDAANLRKGLKFEEGAMVPESVWKN